MKKFLRIDSHAPASPALPPPQPQQPAPGSRGASPAPPSSHAAGAGSRERTDSGSANSLLPPPPPLQSGYEPSLSGASLTYFDYAPAASLYAASSPFAAGTPYAAGPGSSLGTAAAPQREPAALERSELHRSLKSLEQLLVAFDEYRDLAARLAKCERKLGKACKELAVGKAFGEVPVQTLLSSSFLFDAVSESSIKHAKLIQREYEALNEHCAKYFKRVAKEERAHDEALETLDSKVKKAHASHEKNVKRAGGRAIESHDRYIAAVQGLTGEISRAKAAHALSIGGRNEATSLVVAAALGGLADAEFRRLCEGVRRAGAHVGRVNSWLNLAMQDALPAGQPAEIGEEELGRAAILAMAEMQAQANAQAREAALQAAREQAQAAWTAQQLGWLPPQQQQQHQAASAATQQQPAPTQAQETRTSSMQQAAQTYANVPRQDGESAPQPSAPVSPVKAANPAVLATPAAAPVPAPAHTPSPAPAPAAAAATSEPAAASSSATASAAAPNAAAASPNTSRPFGPRAQKSNDVPSASTSAPAAPAETAHAEKSSMGRARGLLNFRRKSSTGPAPSTPADSVDSAATGKSTAPDGGALTRIDTNASVASRASLKTSPVAVTNAWSAAQQNGHAQRASSGDEGTVIDRLERQAEPSEPTSRGALPQAPEQTWRSSSARPALPDDLNGARPSQDAASRARDDARVPDGFGGLGFPSKSPVANEASEAQPLTRRTSLWERERERERHLEREAELQRRLGDADERIRRGQRAGAGVAHLYSPPGSDGGQSANATPTKGSSFSLMNRAGVGAYQPMHADAARSEERPRESYPPAVGGSRLSGVSVNRTLSSESERSFVARMKARYQEEKARGEESPSAGGGYRRVTSPLPHDMPKNTRRVSDLAGSYSATQARAAAAYDDRPYYERERDGDTGGYGAAARHSARPPIASSSGARYAADSAPARGSGAAYGDERYGGVPDEFGGSMRRGTAPPSAAANGGWDAHEAPHSDVCGCQRCSARNYGTAPRQASRPASSNAPPPPPRHPAAAAAERAAAALRAPADPRGEQTRRLSAPYPSAYREEREHLDAPRDSAAAARPGAYPRRSYEDAPERRVAFSHGPPEQIR